MLRLSVGTSTPVIQMKDVGLFEMAPGEELKAANVLSVAMVSNPIHIAVMQGQGEGERQSLEDRFLEMLEERPGEVFLAKLETTIAGVLRSQACHGVPAARERAMEEHEIDEAFLVEKESRFAYWRHVWNKHDPLEPHQHLGPVGVIPRFQGHGIGSKLMVMFCSQVDIRNEPAYLETDSRENVGFYEKFRFRLIGETDIFNVKNFFMWRPAQV